jgi:hypothetical protein
MESQLCSIPVAMPQCQQKDWPHRHVTWLQPPSLKTGFLHLGQGFECAWIQLELAVCPASLSHHRRHISHEQGVCACSKQEKQKRFLQRQVASHTNSIVDSPSSRTARPQCGVEGHHFTIPVRFSSTNASSKARFNRSSTSASP